MAKKNHNEHLDLLSGNADTMEVLDAAVERTGATQRNETADERFVRQIKEAQSRVKQFELSPLVKALLEAACRNVAQATGLGIEDENARAEIRDRAALFEACGYDVRLVLVQIAESCESTASPGLCYSVCFAVQKAANFIGNLRYRRSLDPNDGEGTPAHDYREVREAAYGLGPDEHTHPDDPRREDEYILEALDTLHIYLQLLTEAFGWDPENPMPYLFVQNKDGSFAAVHDVSHAMDIMEVRAQTARVKRAERRSKGLQAALKGARDQLLNA